VLIDTHCHLDFINFDNDRAEVLERAKIAGVSKILTPGIDLGSSQTVITLAETYDQVYAAVGVHPNSATSWNHRTLAVLEDLASHPKVNAIGEIGLDYYRDQAPHDLQKRVFLQQLDLAARFNLPVVIHNRQSTADMLEILVEWQSQLALQGSALAERPGVLHSYSDALQPAVTVIKHNFYIGFTGPVTFQNAKELQHVAETLPLKNMVVETDAPFLSPHPYRGKRNEPARVRLVAEKIAQLKQQPYDLIARVTSENAIRLFNW
jgi:TatD DNase family protein